MGAPFPAMNDRSGPSRIIGFCGTENCTDCRLKGSGTSTDFNLIWSASVSSALKAPLCLES